MIYTNDRLKITEYIYPTTVGNEISILSSSESQTNLFAIFSSFKFSAWITILSTFIISITLNSFKPLKNERKKFKILETVMTITLDHLLILIGKCKLF